MHFIDLTLRRFPRVSFLFLQLCKPCLHCKHSKGDSCGGLSSSFEKARRSASKFLLSAKLTLWTSRYLCNFPIIPIYQCTKHLGLWFLSHRNVVISCLLWVSFIGLFRTTGFYWSKRSVLHTLHHRSDKQIHQKEQCWIRIQLTFSFHCPAKLENFRAWRKHEKSLTYATVHRCCLYVHRLRTLSNT